MARQIIMGGGQSVSPATLSTQGTARQTSIPSERLRRTRSSRYLEAIRALDAGGQTGAADRIGAIRDAVAAEFPDGPGSWPLGWVAKCFLGPPFEVHLLDMAGQIVRHFRVGEALPEGMERARRLAASGQYLLIEVFSDKLVAVGADGSTAVLG